MNTGSVINSKSNARVKALRSSFAGNARKPGELLGVEGATLILEAARSGLGFEAVYFRQGSERLRRELEVGGVATDEWHVLEADVFDSAVGTQSPQGVAATMPIPALKPLETSANPGIFLMLEDVQDPGNVGTLIRSAEAFGARCVYATAGTANVWNPKVLRASAGSVFRMRTFVVTMDEFSATMQQAAIRTIAAVAAGKDAVAVHRSNLHAPCALMIGSEGAGLSLRALHAADRKVHIPCAIESLNAAIAGSLLLFEAARQNDQLSERGAL